MMIIVSHSRLRRLFWLLLLAAAWTMPAAQSASHAEPITFPHENASDLRGVLNVFAAFKRACLDQPVTQDLPDTLLPEGYRVVSSTFHLFGEEQGRRSARSILSRTGTEEGDFAEGHPIIDLNPPRDGSSDGSCRVVWNRAWDYPEPLDDIIFDLAAVLDAWISYELRAFRVSRPESAFAVSRSYHFLSEWAAPCWKEEPCRFTVLAGLNAKEGILLTISRDQAPRK